MEERRAKHVPSKRGLLCSERGACTDSALNHLVRDSDSFSRRCEASDVCFFFLCACVVQVMFLLGDMMSLALLSQVMLL